MSDSLKVTKVLVRNSAREFLVVKDRDTGQWELPGGIIEEGENRFEAAERELKEETGLEIEEFEDVVRVEVEAGQTVNCHILFAGTGETEIELYEDELSDFRWVTPEEFRDMNWHADAGYGLPPMVFLEDYLSNR